jgi:4-amino-4-deoxy-L-arabinose transferase-like glycosyltransferase
MILKYKYRQIPLALILLFVIYCAIIIFFANHTPVGDEVGYSMYADNITHGFYTDKNDVNIWWEPGYPVILALFNIMNFPVILIKLFNALFYIVAVLLFYKIALSFTDEKKSLYFSLLLGIWPPYIRMLIYQNSEALSCMLVAVIFYYSYFLLKNKEINYKKILVLSLALFYLAFTKAIFGYAIVTCIIICAVYYLFAKNKVSVKISLITLLISFIFCLPYLFYTYSLTGKMFFWSNRGGVNIYHSTTPFEGEYGDWFGYNIYLENPQAMTNHKEALDETKNMKALEKDDKFRELGIQHLKNNPVKFIKNWFVGLGRLMFNYPFSYSLQKPDTYFFIIPNMFLFSFLFISAGALIKFRKKFPYEFSFIILLAFVYLGGISLAAAVARYTALVYPLFFSLILYVFTKIIKINIIED